MLSHYLPIEVKMSGSEVMEAHPTLSSVGEQTKTCSVFSREREREEDTCSTRDDTWASDCPEFFTSKGFRV